MKLIFGIWTACVAISISLVAAYYSIVGLTAIFAAAVIPIIVMGSVLELAKITTAVWLHLFGSTTTRLIRYYLTGATMVLMLITSMGIFGFLSKAHIEQQAAGDSVAAQITQIVSKQDHNSSLSARALQKISTLQSAQGNTDTRSQKQISRQQTLIAEIQARLQQDIATQRDIIQQASVPDLASASALDRLLAQRTMSDKLVASSNTKLLQKTIGVKADGVFGSASAAALRRYNAAIDAKINKLQTRMSAAAAINQPEIKASRQSISKLQQVAAQEIKKANAAIDVLRSRNIDSSISTTVDSDVAAQEAIIEALALKSDKLAASKFALETKLRALSVEVGPVKYLAELVYSRSDTAVLEKAVRAVIILLVIVFDPLAIAMILAAASLLRTVETPTTPIPIEPIEEEPEPIEPIEEILEEPIQPIEEILEEPILEPIEKKPTKKTRVAAVYDNTATLRART